ncbi:hypothetical protein COF37_25180 [Bacillus wiedmannii]|uniref:hypothetical protein n=1 Tax=Bacillus wiedmannii TaxID=1890302 RepID=UPI000BF18CC8|nr:hypothetical protein [Bacillus wiedmannii]PEL14629.1 hypothetical protein CN599_28325 [Bacillus wiedmannii]PHD19106.1 hypothetical protein COF37_25180 [Bacillus wiedmannii]
MILLEIDTYTEEDIKEHGEFLFGEESYTDVGEIHGLTLVFDEQGAKRIMHSMKKLLLQKNVEIVLDKPAYWKDKWYVERLQINNVPFSQEIQEGIDYRNGTLFFDFYFEAIDYTIYKLLECIEQQNKFSPAEIIDLYYNNEEITLYGFFENNR